MHVLASAMLMHQQCDRPSARTYAGRCLQPGTLHTCDTLQLGDPKASGCLIACHNQVLLGDSCMCRPYFQLPQQAMAMSALNILQQHTSNELFLTKGNVLQAWVAILLHLNTHTEKCDNPCAVLVTDEGERA